MNRRLKKNAICHLTYSHLRRYKGIGKHDLQERISTREGEHQLEYGEEMGLGTRKYELIEVK